MSRLFSMSFDSEKLLQNGILIALLSCAATMPISTQLFGACSIVALLVWLLLNREMRRIKIQPIFFLGAAFFLVEVIGVINSANTTYAFRKLETNLSLILFPLIFFIGVDNKRKLNFICLFETFVITIVVYGLYCHARTIGEIFQVTGDLRSIFNYQFSHTGLTKFISLHPSYFSVYTDLCLGFLFFNKEFKWFKFLFLRIIVIGYLITLNVHLASRVGFAGMVIIFIMFYGKLVFEKKYLRAILIFLLVTILMTLLIESFVTLKSRILKVVQGTEEPIGRDVAMQCSRNLISVDMMLFGYGTGDAQEKLRDCYEHLGHEGLAEVNLNSHNAFITSFLQNGLLGILSLLAILSYGLYVGIKKGNWVVVTFVILMVLFGLTESYLSTQKGSAFFGFFWSALISYARVEENQ